VFVPNSAPRSTSSWPTGSSSSSDVGLEARREAEVGATDLVGVERQPVVHLRQHAVLLAQRQVELLAEDLRVEEVLDS